MADVEKERQNGRDGDWQLETPYKEELEFVRRSSNLRFEGVLMRRAYGNSGDWENYLEVFLKDDRLSMWAYENMREGYDEVGLEDEVRVSIAQDIPRKSTDFLKRIIAPSDGVGGVTLSFVCHIVIGGSRRGTATGSGCLSQSQ